MEMDDIIKNLCTMGKCAMNLVELTSETRARFSEELAKAWAEEVEKARLENAGKTIVNEMVAKVPEA